LPPRVSSAAAFRDDAGNVVHPTLFGNCGRGQAEKMMAEKAQDEVVATG